MLPSSPSTPAGRCSPRTRPAFARWLSGPPRRPACCWEFGVFEGRSINQLARFQAARGDGRTLYGFDSFQGLSESWGGTGRGRGSFDRGGALPAVEPGVELVPGWVDDTLGPFLESHPDPIAFLHLDLDTYSPTRTVLSLAWDRLQPGSVLLFDELLGYPGWQHQELRALEEEIAPRWRYRFLGFCEPRTRLGAGGLVKAALQLEARR